MNDRVHRALDNELTTKNLTPEESAELTESRALFEAVLRSIPSEPVPDLGPNVLRRIDAAQRSPAVTHEASGPIGWLFASHRISIHVRPAYALALAAILTLVIGLRDSSKDRATPAPTVAVSSAPGEVLVHFSLRAPNAQAVSLASDFSNWAPSYAMKRSEPGVWTIVVPLTPGVHDYSFIVDGEKWTPDPAAPATPDGFGGMNSRIAVIAPDRRT